MSSEKKDCNKKFKRLNMPYLISQRKSLNQRLIHGPSKLKEILKFLILFLMLKMLEVDLLLFGKIFFR